MARLWGEATGQDYDPPFLDEDDASRLWGGATGPDSDPPSRPFLDEDDARETDAAILEAPRSRWERVRIEGEWVEVEVERLEPPSDEEGDEWTTTRS